jgi:hypothetical protein
MKKLWLFALLTAGCGGGGYSSPSTYAPAPTVPQNARVTGPFNLGLTSNHGNGKTYIYTNFAPTGTTSSGAISDTFSGSSDTLVCPANDVRTCVGTNPSAPITPTGTLDGQNLTITVSVPSSAGTDTLTLVGTVSGTIISGAYTDTLGDAGTWTAVNAPIFGGTYTGTLNSTSHPLTIAPSITLVIAEDATFHLTGTATILNSPCVQSLTFTGQAVGQAFTLNDTVNQATIIALPTNGTYGFSYNFTPASPACPSDSGLGSLANPFPWDY